MILKFSVQETDKATIDVEAQEDGILGKILVRDFVPLPRSTSIDLSPIPRLMTVPRMYLSEKSLPYLQKKEMTFRTSNPRLRRQNRNRPNPQPHRNPKLQGLSQPRPLPRPLLHIRTNTLSTLGHYSHPFFGYCKNTMSNRSTK